MTPTEASLIRDEGRWLLASDLWETHEEPRATPAPCESPYRTCSGCKKRLAIDAYPLNANGAGHTRLCPGCVGRVRKRR